MHQNKKIVGKSSKRIYITDSRKNRIDHSKAITKQILSLEKFDAARDTAYKIEFTLWDREHPMNHK